MIDYTTMSLSSGSSAGFSVTYSTRNFTGWLHLVRFIADGTNPLTAGASGILRIRANSTTGRILMRSSSGIIANNYYPRATVVRATSPMTKFYYHSSGSTKVRQTAPIPMWRDKLCFIMQAASSTGTTCGAHTAVYLQGINPY